jgi:ABC-type uncharacterized transport system involved in gliding motility auxiliary subunit
VPIGTPVTNPITENFDMMTAFPLARSVTPIEGGVNGHDAHKFIETSPKSWGETNLADLFSKGKPQQDAGDKAGPVSIAASVSTPVAEPAAAAGAPPDADAPKPETRVAVVGDSDFAANSTIQLPGNRELFLNMVNWLAQQENLIAIRPRDPQDRPLTMTEDQRQMILWLTLVIVPGLLLANGARVWWRRRA